MSAKVKRILVTASTFPRWKNDNTPPFVEQFCRELIKDTGAKVYALAPHAIGAKTREIKYGVQIKRFRYFFPDSEQTLAYDGGAVGKISKSPIYTAKLLCFIVSLFFNTLFISLYRRINIINAHWIIPQGFVAVLVKYITQKKTVISVHGGDIFSLNSPLLVQIKRFVLQRADMVVVNSSATLQACKDIYPDGNYTVIPMGIDTEHFRPQKPLLKLKRKYNLSDFTVLFVGRLSEEKGVLYLCQALQKLKAAGHDFHALIVGDGPELPKLKKYVAANNLDSQISFTGWISTSEIVDFYNIASVFAGPSIIAKTGWKEALGLVFVEALACGVPVIATDTGGIKDVVTGNKTGFLVDEKSADAIFDKLLVLKQSPELQKSFSENARQDVIERFSWPSVIRRYDQVFRKIN